MDDDGYLHYARSVYTFDNVPQDRQNDQLGHCRRYWDLFDLGQYPVSGPTMTRVAAGKRVATTLFPTLKKLCGAHKAT